MFQTFPMACLKCSVLYIIISFNLQDVWIYSVDNEVDLLIYCLLAGKPCTACVRSALCLTQMRTMLTK